MGFMRFGATKILRADLDQALEEEKTFGAPKKETLLRIAQKLVQWAENRFTQISDPSYTRNEKVEAKTLLTKYGMKKFCNLSPRYKHATLELIEKEMVLEAQ